MSSSENSVVGKAYQKRKLKRSLLEMVGNYRYSRPALNDLDRKLSAYIIGQIGKRPGFFIEAGANDGFNQSNTYYFARRYNWRGLLIEPVPHLADHCQQIRSESIVVRSALGAKQDEGSTVKIHMAGLMSTVEGAIGDDDRQRDHLEKATQLQPGVTTGVIEVPSRALSSIIDEHHPSGKIDLLSLDVEGYEAQALAGLDFAKHRPRFICVEANDPDAVAELLDPHYDLIEKLSHHDRLYQAKAPIE